VHMSLPIGDRSVTLIVDGFSDYRTTQFDQIEGNAVSVKRDLLQPNQAYRYEFNVRLKGDQAQITFLLNGERIIDQSAAISAISPRLTYALGTNTQPGLSNYETKVLYTRCQVRPITGSPSIGRAVPLIKPIPANILALKATPVTSLPPLSVEANSNLYAVSSVSRWDTVRNPKFAGVDCTNFIFAHAPSKLQYSIPPGSKYFTAIGYNARTSSVKFIVRADGKEIFSSEGRPIATVVAELPEGAKTLELECNAMGDGDWDHSFWCLPAFR
jgi:hypothetical protein